MDSIAFDTALIVRGDHDFDLVIRLQSAPIKVHGIIVTLVCLR
jgi:hypothetical protein